FFFQQKNARLNALGYRLKCFYFVEDEADWNTSQSFCLSFGAHLTTIDSPEELDFLLRCGRSIHFWVGLRREGSAPWKWFNGTFLNSSFPIRGDGQCAYINLNGVSSDWCSQKKYSVCSHPKKHQQRGSGVKNPSEFHLNYPPRQSRRTTSCY
uniref:C-type lectin domain-containing protein n=1 Tax=Bubo bubo TaxID=30461 RepID=A0A8C0FL05_BUBBB